MCESFFKLAMGIRPLPSSRLQAGCRTGSPCWISGAVWPLSLRGVSAAFMAGVDVSASMIERANSFRWRGM